MLSKIYDIEILPLCVNSLSISPRNKKNTIQCDNLEIHSGYIQYFTIINLQKINENIVITIEKNGSSILLQYELDEKYNNCSIDEKNKEFERIHELGQIAIGKMVDELKNIIRNNPSKYQSQIATISGLTNNIYNDNNRICVTLLDMMCKQNIIKKNNINDGIC